MLHDLRVVVAKVGVRHTKWLKDAAEGEFAEGLTADTLHDLRE